MGASAGRGRAGPRMTHEDQGSCIRGLKSTHMSPPELICPAAIAIRHRLARVAAQSGAWQPSRHVLRTVAAALPAVGGDSFVGTSLKSLLRPGRGGCL